MARRAPAVSDPGDGIDHGTAGGELRCRDRYGTTCEQCRSYRRDAVNRHRIRRPDLHAEQIRRDRAHDAALRELARRHPVEFGQIHREQLALLCRPLPNRKAAS